MSCEMNYNIWLNHLHLSRSFSAECLLAAVHDGDWGKAADAQTRIAAIDKVILKIMDLRGKHIPEHAVIEAYWAP